MKAAIPAAALVALTLTACAGRQAEKAAEAGIVDLPPTVTSGQLEFRLASGSYRCDMGHRVEVTRSPADTNTIDVNWTGRRYTLQRNPSHSGLPRYEDASSGLVWIDLPWKGMLLDARTNRPLASDCVLS